MVGIHNYIVEGAPGVYASNGGQQLTFRSVGDFAVASGNHVNVVCNSRQFPGIVYSYGETLPSMQRHSYMRNQQTRYFSDGRTPPTADEQRALEMMNAFRTAVRSSPYHTPPN
jgi:hypothetical protein